MIGTGIGSDKLTSSSGGTPPPPDPENRITENNDDRVTEDGNLRILE